MMSSLLCNHTRIFTYVDLDHKNLQKKRYKTNTLYFSKLFRILYRHREPYNKQGLAENKQRGASIYLTNIINQHMT